MCVFLGRAIKFVFGPSLGGAIAPPVDPPLVCFMLTSNVLQCRVVRRLGRNARRDIVVVETKDGNRECEAKLLHLRTKTTIRHVATRMWKQNQSVDSRHLPRQRLTDNPAFWDCHNVGHFLPAVLASTWAKQPCLIETVICDSVLSDFEHISELCRWYFNDARLCCRYVYHMWNCNV